MVDDGAPGVKAPDGGWGWAVLAGCFVITGFSYAFPKAVSVFFKELILEFGVGYSDTAWISSILLAMLYGTGDTPERAQCLNHPFLCIQCVNHCCVFPRTSVQCVGQQVWLSTCDDCWWTLCLNGNDSGLFCHEHRAHLPWSWSDDR